MFTPDRKGEMEGIFWYAMGHALDRHPGIELQAACLMSTHPHYNINDRLEEAPDFYQTLHRTLAAATKAFRGWPEEVFNKSSTAAHEALTPQALVKALAYTIANPTAAFAVKRSEQWPGATVSPWDIGTRVITVKRPTHYFRDEEIYAEEYTFALSMPEVLIAEYGSLERAQQRIAAKVKELETKARMEAKLKRYYFKGVCRVFDMRHTKRAKGHEVFGSRNPRFAAEGDSEAAKAAVERNRIFDDRYTHALELCKEGQIHRAIFPYGTWKMRKLFKVRVHPPPEA